jgi:hypothetical protein
MIKKIIICLTALFLMAHVHAQLQVINALCNNSINPYGVHANDIHFSWQMQSTKNNQYQTAYQIVIASSAKKLSGKEYDVWNSSIIKNDSSILIRYKGKKLNAAATYYWQVRVWDENNQSSGWSAAQQFTTDLPSAKDWLNAKWIGYEELPDSMRVAPGLHYPTDEMLGNKCRQRAVIPLFRKNFSIQKRYAMHSCL